MGEVLQEIVVNCEGTCCALYLCNNARMMEWSDLRIFLAAVRAGSYTLAGTQLGINRTTVGRRVDALEAALGVALFKETAFGHEPTREGRILLESAARMEAEAETMLKALGSVELPKETIRIASSAGIASEFLDCFDRFQQAVPEAVIELIGLPDPLEAVSARRADIALALVRRPPRRLSGRQVGVLSQAPYRKAGSSTLRKLGWGREIEAAIPGQWTVANPVGDGAEEAGVARFNNWDQLKLAVMQGMGSASLWCFAADRHATLERLSSPDPRHDSPLWLLHRSKSPPSPCQSALLDFLAREIPAMLAGSNGESHGDE
ncbi:MAG: LysR family transcriptional regulator [Sphingomonadaceae bacterium]|nr:LysR family transcriptional regulator [Sphingomonadaceae bacterium]